MIPFNLRLCHWRGAFVDRDLCMIWIFDSAFEVTMADGAWVLELVEALHNAIGLHFQMDSWSVTVARCNGPEGAMAQPGGCGCGVILEVAIELFRCGRSLDDMRLAPTGTDFIGRQHVVTYHRLRIAHCLLTRSLPSAVDHLHDVVHDSKLIPSSPPCEMERVRLQAIMNSLFFAVLCVVLSFLTRTCLVMYMQFALILVIHARLRPNSEARLG